MKGDASEWESDDEILWSKVIEDESIPNNPEPVVPIILREPDAPPPIANAAQKLNILLMLVVHHLHTRGDTQELQLAQLWNLVQTKVSVKWWWRKN